MLVAGESSEIVWEFCLVPAAEVSWVILCKKAGIEKMLAETKAGANKESDTPDDASANHKDLLSFTAADGLAGEETEFLDFKALI